jgi:hypothetical protein
VEAAPKLEGKKMIVVTNRDDLVLMFLVADVKLVKEVAFELLK